MFKNRLKIASSLSLADWFVLGEAWWGLLKFNLALRKMSFERLQNMPAALKGQPATSPLLTAQHLHQLVGYASHLHLLPMTCLPRSITLRNMLTRRSIPAVIQIGAKKTALGIHAHAWVEVEGQAVGEDGVLERFSPLVSTEIGHSVDQKKD